MTARVVVAPGVHAWRVSDDIAVGCLLLPCLCIVAVGVSRACSLIVLGGVVASHGARLALAGEGALGVGTATFFLAVTFLWVSTASHAVTSGVAALAIGLGSTWLLVLLAAWVLLREEWMTRDAPEFSRLLIQLLRGCAPISAVAFPAWAGASLVSPALLPWAVSAAWLVIETLWPCESGMPRAVRAGMCVLQPTFVRVAMRGLLFWSPADIADVAALGAVGVLTGWPPRRRLPRLALACLALACCFTRQWAEELHGDASLVVSTAGAVAAVTAACAGVLASSDGPPWVLYGAATAAAVGLWTSTVGPMPLLLPVPIVFVAAATWARRRAVGTVVACIAGWLTAAGAWFWLSNVELGALDTALSVAIPVVMSTAVCLPALVVSAEFGAAAPSLAVRGSPSGGSRRGAACECILSTCCASVALAEAYASAPGIGLQYSRVFVAGTSCCLAVAIMAVWDWRCSPGLSRRVVRVSGVAAVLGKLVLMSPPDASVAVGGGAAAEVAFYTLLCGALALPWALPDPAAPIGSRDLSGRRVGGATPRGRGPAVTVLALCVAGAVVVSIGVVCWRVSWFWGIALWLVSSSLAGSRVAPKSAVVARGAAVCIAAAVVLVLVASSLDGVTLTAWAWCGFGITAVTALVFSVRRPSSYESRAGILARIVCAAIASAGVAACTAIAVLPSCVNPFIFPIVCGSAAAIGIELGASAHADVLRQHGLPDCSSGPLVIFGYGAFCVQHVRSMPSFRCSQARTDCLQPGRDYGT